MIRMHQGIPELFQEIPIDCTAHCYAHKNTSFNYKIKNNYIIYKNIIQYNKQYVVKKNVDIL